MKRQGRAGRVVSMVAELKGKEVVVRREPILKYLSPAGREFAITRLTLASDWPEMVAQVARARKISE